MLSPINLKEVLIKIRANHLKEVAVLSWVETVFKELEAERTQTLQVLQTNHKTTTNTFDFDKLDVNDIFHINQIKQICIDYRLRFLDSTMFKGGYPEEAITKIQHLEKEHATKLGGFKIVAPAKVFKLKKADDPMLFAPMGNKYYYLIHQWGNDLHPLRKVKYWAIKSVENFVTSLFIISTLFTAITYPFFFTKEVSFGYILLLFMFYFKAFVGLSLFYGISLGKNFSNYSWNSKYDKVC